MDQPLLFGSFLLPLGCMPLNRPLMLSLNPLTPVAAPMVDKKNACCTAPPRHLLVNPQKSQHFVEIWYVNQTSHGKSSVFWLAAMCVCTSLGFESW
jgi:hypothetical protein